jgi:hypothetical protein
VEQYNHGQRGIAGLMLMTDQLDKIRQELIERGLTPTQPERISISFLLNWFKKVFPWRNVYVGPIPGTDLTISFQEMDSDRAMKSMERYMVPNTRDAGVKGISTAIVRQAFSDEAWLFIQKLFASAVAGDDRIIARHGGDEAGVAGVGPVNQVLPLSGWPGDTHHGGQG